MDEASKAARRALHGHDISDEQLLAAVNELVRTIPNISDVLAGKVQAVAWDGKAAATLRMWDAGNAIPYTTGMSMLRMFPQSAGYYHQAISVLFEAQHSLKLRSGARASAVIGKGNVLDYFRAMKEFIEQGQQDVLVWTPISMISSFRGICRSLGLVREFVF